MEKDFTVFEDKGPDKDLRPDKDFPEFVEEAEKDNPGFISK